MARRTLGFLEFFAGGGMARLGLGNRWHCMFANEWCPKKADAYKSNFDASMLVVGDVASLTSKSVPIGASLAWASFPCQDLSLAGAQAGLAGDRSGTFWGFWKIVSGLNRSGNALPVVVLENVVGALSSHDGKDFAAIIEACVEEGYKVGAIVVDAIHFVPQSRPRLFIVACKNVPSELTNNVPDSKWHTSSILRAWERLPSRLQESWVWWRLPGPPERKTCLADLIQDAGEDIEWHSSEQTEKLLSMMSPQNMEKVKVAQASGESLVGTIYKRTRPTDAGDKVQRAEVRFDDAGCLRTPAGGSSRQILIHVEGRLVRTRLLTKREAARLMGLPEAYLLPSNYNEAYHLAGDGLVVGVVSWLETHLLWPLAIKGTQSWRYETTPSPHVGCEKKRKNSLTDTSKSSRRLLHA